MRTAQIALASWPGLDPMRAMEQAVEGASDPLLGPLGCERVSICPQNCRGALDEAAADALMARWPQIEFLLHANVRVGPRHQPRATLAELPHHAGYFRDLAAIARRLQVSHYTVHAGRRHGRWGGLMARVARLERMLGVPVGVEGHYPVAGSSHGWWIDSWDEYERLGRSGVSYVIDLSHLNIVARASGEVRHELVAELVASPRCLEVHVSGNDGTADQHTPLDPANPPWWLPHLEAAHPDALIVYEGCLRQR